MPKVPKSKRVRHIKRHKNTSDRSAIASLENVLSSQAAADVAGEGSQGKDERPTTDCCSHSIMLDEISNDRFSSPLSSPLVVRPSSSLSDHHGDHTYSVSSAPSPSSVSSSGPILSPADQSCAVPENSFPALSETSQQQPLELLPEPLGTSNTTSLLLEAREKLLPFLPRFWTAVVDGPGIFLLMLSRQAPKAIQRSVFINEVGDVKIDVHCQSVVIDPYVKPALPPKALKESTVGYFVDRAVQIIYNIRMREVCSGCDFEEYVSVWSKCERGEIDRNPYQECRYSETFRSFKCSRLIDASKWRCYECSKLQVFLKRRLKAETAETVHQKTSNVNLTESQKLQKLKDQRKELSSVRRKLQRLRSQKLIAEEGIQVDKTLSDDLTEVLRSADLSPEQSLFFQEQVKASQVKNMCGMRWHPTMIRLALSVYLSSPSAYETLRDSGVVKLPSSRTLFDYTHFKPIKEGLDEVALQSVAERVDKLPEKYQKYHVLMGDEVYISKNLVIQKSTGRIIGFTKLDELDREVRAMEAFLDDPSKTVESVEATKVMTFMVKGVSNNIKEVIASYPVHSFSPQQMYSWTWHIIGALERSGIAIVAFVCDGSPTNRAFINLHKPKTPSASGLVYDTVNKAAPHRALYFISDVPHLLKTIRNCFAKSRLGKKGKRILTKNGQKIVWDTIIKLYNAKKGKSLRKSYKLNPQNVFLDSYSCMKVSLAAQVLSRTVAQDLKDQNWEGISETILFIITFNDWFDCLNGAHSSQGKKTKNPRLDPYTSTEDSRFDFLRSVLKYLHDWKTEAQSISTSTTNISLTSELDDVTIPERDNSFTPIEDFDEADNIPASKKLLSHQTMLGIEMTTLSFIAVTTFLLEEKTKFVNARVFCQDALEQYFSKQRAGGGGSSNPNYDQFLSKQRGIHMQGQTGVKRKRKGNTEVTASKLQITEEPLPKRKSMYKLQLT